MNELHSYFEQLNTYIIKILVLKKDNFSQNGVIEYI